MPEMIDLTQFEIIRTTKSFCWCGARVLLLYNGKAPNDPDALAYYACPRCKRIAKLGEDGGDIRPADPDVEKLQKGELDEYEEELMEILDER